MNILEGINIDGNVTNVLQNCKSLVNYPSKEKYLETISELPIEKY